MGVYLDVYVNGLDQSQLFGAGHGLRSIFNPQLAVDVVNVGLYGPWTQVQHCCNFPVG